MIMNKPAKLDVPCLICGSNLQSFHVFPRKALFNKPLLRPVPEATAMFGIAYCPSCRHVSSARKSSYNMDNLEEIIYGELYENLQTSAISPSHKRYIEFVSDWVASVLPPGCRVLEIGSHDGYFLHLLQKRGFDCHGIEPSPLANLSAKKYSLPITREFFDANLYEPESFDLVVAKHVVEHVTDPVRFVRNVSIILKKGGLFYMEVPNSLVSLEQTYFPEFHIDHVSYFTPASVLTLLRTSGILGVLHMETVYAFMKFPFINVLSRKNSANTLPISTYFQDFNIHFLIDRFVSKYERYKQNVERIPDQYRLAVWGTGSIGTQYAIDGQWTTDEVIVVDLNKANHGKFLSVTGHEVMPIDEIRNSSCDAVLIASGWEDDVGRQIVEHGLGEKAKIIRFADIIK